MSIAISLLCLLSLQDNDSHFHAALLHWQELNLAPAFLEFARHADPLSASMPLLLHNWREIVELWLGALEKSNDEGLKAILECVLFLHFDNIHVRTGCVACSKSWRMTYGQRSPPNILVFLGDSSSYYRARSRLRL